jgi:hypothetical protein
MDKLRALLALFRQGNEVANPGAWKNATIVANLLLAVAAVAAAFGFKVELTGDNASAIAAGGIALVGVVNGVLHAVTSKRAGLPAADPPPPDSASPG